MAQIASRSSEGRLSAILPLAHEVRITAYIEGDMIVHTRQMELGGDRCGVGVIPLEAIRGADGEGGSEGGSG